MIRIQSQAEKDWGDRFYTCKIVEDPDPKEIKMWQMLIGEEETITESDLIDRILALLGKEETPEKNTRALNMVFEARNNGYIIDIGIPRKHVYRINNLIKIK